MFRVEPPETNYDLRFGVAGFPVRVHPFFWLAMIILGSSGMFQGDRGFDQQAGFERGTPQNARDQVHTLFSEKPQGGYICCASDHFFHGDPENLQAFVDAAKECVYD